MLFLEDFLVNISFSLMGLKLKSEEAPEMEKLTYISYFIYIEDLNLMLLIPIFMSSR